MPYFTVHRPRLTAHEAIPPSPWSSPFPSTKLGERGREREQRSGIRGESDERRAVTVRRVNREQSAVNERQHVGASAIVIVIGIGDRPSVIAIGIAIEVVVACSEIRGFHGVLLDNSSFEREKGTRAPG